MYFDFEGRHFETPTIESAMTWRDQLLASAIAHVGVLLLVLIVPQLSFVQEAAERRAERLVALAEQQAELLALQPQPEDDQTFVYIVPRVELDTTEPPRPEAVPSDRDRIAMSPERAEDPTNRLPFADGNAPEFVIAEEPTDGLVEVVESDAVDPVEEVEEVEVEALAETLEPVDPTAGTITEVEESDQLAELTPSVDEPGGFVFPAEQGKAFVSESTLPERGVGDPDPPSDDPGDPDGLLAQAMQNLRQTVRRQSFGNLRGDTGRYGPEIQFDSKGVEFGPWIRRFVAQVRRNWFVPYAFMTMHGHVVVTFYVHDDGTISEVQVVKPSNVNGFNNSAFNAILSSNPTQALPPEYPDDSVFFTVTFFYNESPPLR